MPDLAPDPDLPGTDPAPPEQETPPGHDALLPTLTQAARRVGVDLDTDGCQGASPAAVVATLRAAGLWAKAASLSARQLARAAGRNGAVVLLLRDGSAALLEQADSKSGIVLLSGAPGLAGPVDPLRLSHAWAGAVVLIRRERGTPAADQPFSIGWLTGLVLGEGRALRDVALASLVLSVLTVFPPLIVMQVVDRVLSHHSPSTLWLLTGMLGAGAFYETLLGYARRLIVLGVGTRLDARLNMHVFRRLLRLPLPYFETHPAGEVMHNVAAVYKVREFLTGKLLSTVLDLITLLVLVPFLFYLSPVLAGVVLGCTGLIAIVILAFLTPMRRAYARVIRAETGRAALLGESIVGVKTLKSLALEPQRLDVWESRVAEASHARLAMGKLANWPQTLTTPLERIMSNGTILMGAALALSDPAGYAVGGLFAFMLLSGRVAQPLVGLARLLEEYEDITSSVAQAGSVLNQPLEESSPVLGQRPAIQGEIAFEEVTFTYPGARGPALDEVTFSLPSGTSLGIVGRSGSGKSTITRLLQAISRDYQGRITLDGTDLRAINLRHLRTSCGIVLQENVLFRGTVTENLIAGRAGLTPTDAVRAARLAGAEEFIERMPHGYETVIEEGSPNLSGGQRQRLAIARALITDPKLLILDEATSALDPESEALVNANLARIGKDRTLIVISHRLSSLTECDSILVLDQGSVVGCGPHRVLLDRCQLYRSLWSQQNRHADTGRPHAQQQIFLASDRPGIAAAG